jgi:hypothetical protein
MTTILPPGVWTCGCATADAGRRFHTNGIGACRDCGAFNPNSPAGVAERSERYAAGQERALQHEAETYLSCRGYLRLTADNAGKSPRGWFGHWPATKRNPQLADLAVFDGPMRRVLFIELKAGALPTYQPGQREHIAAGRWVECRTFDEVRAALDRFEAADTEARDAVLDADAAAVPHDDAWHEAERARVLDERGESRGEQRREGA